MAAIIFLSEKYSTTSIFSPSSSLTMDWIRFRIHLIRGDRNWFPPVELVVLDAATGRVLLRATDECRPCFSPDGRFLATNHEDGTILLRDIPGKQKKGCGFVNSGR